MSRCSIENRIIKFIAKYTAYSSEGYLCTTETPSPVYFEAQLDEKLLLTEQKSLTVQPLDYSAKVAGSPARLCHSSNLREQHEGEQQRPAKPLLLGLKNYVCSRARGQLQHRPPGGGKTSHRHFSGAKCFPSVCGPRPRRASTAWHSPSQKMNCEVIIPGSCRQCPEASPHTVGV